MVSRHITTPNNPHTCLCKRAIFSATEPSSGDMAAAERVAALSLSFSLPAEGMDLAALGAGLALAAPLVDASAPLLLSLQQTRTAPMSRWMLQVN